MESLTAAYILANILLPLLGVALLALKRTRSAGVFLVVVPSSAVGAGLFGLWVVQRLLYGRVSPQRGGELLFYLGWVAFYVLGLALALGLLLFRNHRRPGALLKSAITGIVASFNTLTCLAVIALVWRDIAYHYDSVGWDPISGIASTPAWLVFPEMLASFAIFFVWSSRRLQGGADASARHLS